MSERENAFAANAFAAFAEPPSFTPKPKRDKAVAEETISIIAEQTGFPSRQAPKTKAPARKPRLHRTGRNVQFNAKATRATIDRIYKIADERNLMVAEVLELMLDAYEKQTGQKDETA